MSSPPPLTFTLGLNSTSTHTQQQSQYLNKRYGYSSDMKSRRAIGFSRNLGFAQFSHGHVTKARTLLMYHSKFGHNQRKRTPFRYTTPTCVTIGFSRKLVVRAIEFARNWALRNQEMYHTKFGDNRLKNVFFAQIGFARNSVCAQLGFAQLGHGHITKAHISKMYHTKFGEDRSSGMDTVAT